MHYRPLGQLETVSFFDDQAKLLQIGWEFLIHLPHSSDTTHLDVHLFQSLQNSLNGKKIQLPGKELFAQKDKKFWENEITKLPEKQQKAVEQNSEYFVQ